MTTATLPVRNDLPARRQSWTQKLSIEGQVFYVTFGEYPDASLGEVFVTASKQGTFLRGILDSLGRTISTSLQCGTPLCEIIKTLAGMEFPPQGRVSAPGSNVKSATSLVDYLAKEIKETYLSPLPPEPFSNGDSPTPETPSLQDGQAGYMPEEWR